MDLMNVKLIEIEIEKKLYTLEKWFVSGV